MEVWLLLKDRLDLVKRVDLGLEGVGANLLETCLAVFARELPQALGCPKAINPVAPISQVMRDHLAGLLPDRARFSLPETTTTIRLGDLKDRVATAAEQAGKSTHAYIINAIAESVARDEQRAEFVGAALARRAKYRVSGRTVSFDDMAAYAMGSARGERPSKPRATAKKTAKA